MSQKSILRSLLPPTHYPLFQKPHGWGESEHTQCSAPCVVCVTCVCDVCDVWFAIVWCLVVWWWQCDNVPAAHENECIVCICGMCTQFCCDTNVTQLHNSVNLKIQINHLLMYAVCICSVELGFRHHRLTSSNSSNVDVFRSQSTNEIRSMTLLDGVELSGSGTHSNLQKSSCQNDAQIKIENPYLSTTTASNVSPSRVADKSLSYLLQRSMGSEVVLRNSENSLDGTRSNAFNKNSILSSLSMSIRNAAGTKDIQNGQYSSLWGSWVNCCDLLRGTLWGLDM